METDFFQFITKGKYNVNDERFIDKLLYLGRIYVFIFCLVITVSFIIAIISFHTEFHTIGRIFDTASMKEITLQYMLILLIYPLYTGIFLNCLTHYQYKKVSLSISCIFSSFICLIIYKYFNVPVLMHQYLDVLCLFLFIFTLIYFCLAPAIRSYNIFIEKIWEKRFLLIIYLFSILNLAIIYLYNDGNFQPKIVHIFMNFIIILVLIYIRATMGLKYAILFGYLLSLPGLIILMYLFKVG